MKLRLSAGIPICASVALLTLAIAQDLAPEQKHLSIPTLNGRRPVSISALNIERGVEYPAIIRLTGKVEIKTPVCLPTGKNGSMVCDGEMIVRADEAQLHEDTGQIEAQGNVVVTPLQHRQN